MTLKIRHGVGYSVLCGCLLVWTTLIATASPTADTLGEPKQVILPMTIDYALLNAMVRNTFLEGGIVAGVDTEKSRKTLYYEQDGCQGVVVSAPRFREEGGELLMETQVHLRYGRSMGRYCVLPLSFDGVLVMYQHPSVSPEDWTLRFTPLKSEMRTPDGQPARLASLAWRLVEDYVLGSLAGVSVNLGPPKQELQDFLPLMLPVEDQPGVLEMLRELRPADVLVQTQGLRLENVMTVFDELYQPEPEWLEPYLSDEELERFIVAWEVWDAFLVHLITTLTTRQLTDDEQLLLLDVLLRMRHEFAYHLEDPVGQTDLVRVQFMETWTRLGPLFRGHLLEADNNSLLGYLAFFSASDALLALDKLGPTLGLEISRDGLIRLARLLDNQDTLLDYGPELLPELRRILGLGNRLSNGPDNEDADRESTLPDSPSPRSLKFLQDHLAAFFIGTAQAESPPAELEADLTHWIFQGRDLKAYMDRVTGVLRDRTDEVLDKAEKPADHHDFFHDLALATAWQESCFRQFTTSGKDILYIRSYNNTSVGIMQINERVWRGLYDQTRLRWDIAYNAQAGVEILDLYFAKYAHPRMRKEPEANWTADLQAGMLYAMYNGGPGQLDRFLTRAQENNLFRSDRLFREKWDWIRQDALDKISICLIGR
ncbi:Transglycosylase SLT domain-containing protein [Desulfonatronum zhilinae]|nr:Transglycosylase SLT domain-containing protein [Desulfonatronum zhilinae]